MRDSLVSLQFHIENHIFAFFFLFVSLYFTILTCALPVTSTTILNNSVETGYACLAADFSEKFNFCVRYSTLYWLWACFLHFFLLQWGIILSLHPKPLQEEMLEFVEGLYTSDEKICCLYVDDRKHLFIWVCWIILHL